MSKSAFAQAMAARKVRFVSALGMLGIDYHQWTPAEQGDLVMISGQESMGYKRLANFSGQISRVIDSSFSDLYADMNIISGLSLTGGLYQGHNESVLSGTHSGARDPIYGKSIDVIIEQSPNVYNASNFVPIKAIRMHDHAHLRGFSFDRVNGQRVVSQQLQGDLAMFNTLLGGLTNETNGSSQKQTNRELVVDKVFQDLQALNNNPRISKSDKELLDRYISSLNDLQKRVQGNQAPSCTRPTLSLQVKKSGNFWQFPGSPGSSTWGIENITTMYNNYIEIMKIAFMCDQTRIVHWGLANWDSAVVPGGTAGGLHHEAPSSNIQADRQQYFIKKVADLARALKSTPDPLNEGSILDNTIIFYANELGAWTTAHNTFNMPTITFGKAGGKLSTGHFIDCRQRPLTAWKGYYPGRPYKQFLQAIMSSMGVPKSEYVKFGDGNGFGEFKDTINQFNNTKQLFERYKNVHNDPLPFFYKG